MNPEEFLYHGYVIRKSKDGTFHAFPTTTFSVFHGGTLTEVLNKVGDYVLFNKGKPEQKTDGIFRHETDEYKEAWNKVVNTEEKIREEMKIPLVHSTDGCHAKTDIYWKEEIHLAACDMINRLRTLISSISKFAAKLEVKDNSPKPGVVNFIDKQEAKL